MARLPHHMARDQVNRCARSKMSLKDPDHWMQGAVKHPGALHRELGIPEGKKIPEKRLEAAAHSSNPTLKKRAVLAETFRKEDNHKD